MAGRMPASWRICLPALQHDPNRPEDVLKVDCDEDGNGGVTPPIAFGIWSRRSREGVVQRKLRGL
jgi:hypothetical protein